MYRTLLLLVTTLLFTSCARPWLSVKMRSFDRNDLASYVVDTPDPAKETLVFGQRLYIRWYLPQETFEQAPVTLNIRVRLQNEQEIQEEIPVHGRWGSYMWMIQGKEYSTSGGILAYRITLTSNGTTLAQSSHKFWVEKIQIDSE